MGFADIPYFRGSVGIRLLVEIEDDSGAWVNVNEAYPSGYPDYFGALLRPYTAKIVTEQEPGVYVTETGALSLDNSPIFDYDATNHRLVAGRSFGFWDAPISKQYPVIIRKNGTFPGFSFSSWYRRRVRLSVDFYQADGTFVENQALGVYIIDGDVERTGDVATVKLSGLQKILMEKSAASVKDGTRWYESIPIQALIYKLVSIANPSMEIAFNANDAIDLGTLSEMRTSSWGKCPGWNSDARAVSTEHMIPRALYVPANLPGSVYVGFENPSSLLNPNGAIHRFDSYRGAWRLVAWVSDDVGYPIALLLGASRLFFLAYAESSPANYAAPYVVRLYSTNPFGGPITPHGNAMAFWPGRWIWRKGVAQGAYERHVGFNYWTHYFNGENVVLPFPQVVESLWKWIGEDASVSTEFQWDQYGAYTFINDTNDTEMSLSPDAFAPFGPNRTGGFGCRTTIVQGDPYPEAAAVRYALTTHASVPQAVKLYTGSPIAWKDFLLWVFLNPTAGALHFGVMKADLSGTDPVVSSVAFTGASGLGNDASQLWDRQVIAWAIGPSFSGVTAWRLILSVVEWNEVQVPSSTPPFSRSRVYYADFTSGGATAICSSVWTHLPTASTKAPTVVNFFTPTASDGKTSRDFTLCNVLDRSDVRGLCYGLGVWSDYPTVRWHECPFLPMGSAPAPTREYTGPLSSAPFVDFTADGDNPSEVYFTDQVTGQVYSVEVVTGALPVWKLHNKNAPMHTTERASSTLVGAFAKPPEDNFPRFFFAARPGPPGELLVPYYARPGQVSAGRRAQGATYPLVMLSRKLAHVIEEADLSDLMTWEVLTMIRQLCSQYRIIIGRDGSFDFAKRVAGAPVGRLEVETRTGYVPIESDVFPIEPGFKRKTLTDQIINAVDVTPYALTTAGDPVASPLVGEKSTFGGRFLWNVVTDRPSKISITCAAGGTYYWGAIPKEIPTILFRWSRVLESVSLNLAVACIETSTAITVYGLKRVGQSIYAREQEVTLSDFVQVQDGPICQIVAIGSIGVATVVLTISPAVGVSASVNSEVKIIPRDSASESDGEDGVTKVAAVVLAADTSIQVRSTVPLKKGLVLWIEREALLVQTVDAGSVVVTRGYLWTTAADHPIGAPIKAYVSPIETSKYYEVGDSGILFGVELDSGASAKARTVKVGDGITIETKGLVLKAFEGGITRAADNASINLYGRKDLQIGRNRLLDLVKTDIVAEQTLAEFSEPRVGAQDITSALYYWFEIGDPVEMNDATLIPGGGTVSFEIVSLFFDPAGFRLQIGVRSYDAVEGSGKSSGVVKRGRGAPRGRRGDR